MSVFQPAQLWHTVIGKQGSRANKQLNIYKGIHLKRRKMAGTLKDSCLLAWGGSQAARAESEKNKALDS